jgi:ferredoxin-nitrite reductase
MPLEDGSSIINGLKLLGQSSLMSGLDNLRNMVGSPIAGIDPSEIYDTRALCREIDDWYTNNSAGNPEWANMPRKFNIAISGSRDDFSHTSINDIGLNAIKHEVTGEVGFNVVLGGYFSIKRAAHSIPMNVWIPASQASNLCKAILTLFRDLGGRADRQKARLMWLVESLGMETFTQKVLEEMIKTSPGYSFEPDQKYTEEWTQGHRSIIGVHPQKQEGKSWVGIHVPVGRLSPDECDEIAALADKYSGGEIRFTVEQNVILPNVDNGVIEELLKEPSLGAGKRLSVYPGNIIGGVVSCTGSQFCPLALVETKASIDVITRKLQTLVDLPSPVRIHMTGCPNSCGQVQVADIGLMGAPAKKADASGAMKAVSGVNIFVGGKIGEESQLSTEPLMKGIPFNEEDLVPILAKLLVERHGGVMRV